MNCSEYELHIALHVEGDLPLNEVTALERHLADCADCRAFAAELRECQTEFKELGFQELDPAFVANVRASVLREVERRDAKRFFLRRLFGFAGWRYAVSALTLVVAATAAWQVVRRAPDTPAPMLRIAGPKDVPTADRRTNTVVPPIPVVKSHRVHHHPHPVTPSAVSATVDPRIGCRPFAPPPDVASRQPVVSGSEEKMRVEIQTKNPNVRIIWISQSHPSTEVEEAPSPIHIGDSR